MSPDGRWVVSSGDDDTLRLWAAVGGRPLASCPVSSECVAVHPTLPRAVCGDRAGTVHHLDLMGIGWGSVGVPSDD